MGGEIPTKNYNRQKYHPGYTSNALYKLITWMSYLRLILILISCSKRKPEPLKMLAIGQKLLGNSDYISLEN